jgi:hypothetical protein
MNKVIRASRYAGAAILGLMALAVTDRPSELGRQSIVSTADAIVGRPLTPVSVAGVARRTARRCASGVYAC